MAKPLSQSAMSDAHWLKVQDSAIEQIARWFARTIIADEMHPEEPLPEVLRDAIAHEMVADQDFLGWPSLEDADAHLDAWMWAPPKPPVGADDEHTPRGQSV